MIATTHESQHHPDGDSATQPASAVQADSPRGRRRISLSVINFWLDALLLVVLAVLGWVSATLQVVFPAPTVADGWTLWGLAYDQWRDIQFGVLCVFAIGVLVHLMLHWNWICSVIATQIVRSRTRPDEGMQTIYGVITLIFLLHVIAFGVGAAMFCIHRPTP
ncbi:MAG: DUF4405 domain-containing protein [Isosphaeraceae bacterium]